MADLTRLVDADDPIVADLLTGTLELVAEAGGWLNPRARLVARGGQLCIECDDDTGPLLRIPRAVCVRVDQVAWADDPEHLVIEDLRDEIGEAELPMLYLQVALHNQCGKLPWLTRTHPALATDVPAELADALRALIPSFRMSPMSPRDVLFANRCFRIDLGDGAGPQRLLIPLVDLLNHDNSGATGDWDGSTFEVAISRPFGSAECALDYGLNRDALELATTYGFVDLSAAVAHSAPVVVEVPGLGVVQVVGTGRAPSGTALPIEVFEQSGTVVISHLTFRDDDADAPVRDVIAATRWRRSQAEEVVNALRSANSQLLRNLTDRCSEAESSPAAQTLAAAAHRQRLVLGS